MSSRHAALTCACTVPRACANHAPVHTTYAPGHTMHTPHTIHCTRCAQRYTWLPANAREALAKCLQTPCNHPAQHRTCVTMCARATDQRRILQYRVWRTTMQVQRSFPWSPCGVADIEDLCYNITYGAKSWGKYQSDFSQVPDPARHGTLHGMVPRGMLSHAAWYPAQRRLASGFATRWARRSRCTLCSATSACTTTTSLAAPAYEPARPFCNAEQRSAQHAPVSDVSARSTGMASHPARYLVGGTASCNNAARRDSVQTCHAARNTFVTHYNMLQRRTTTEDDDVATKDNDVATKDDDVATEDDDVATDDNDTCCSAQRFRKPKSTQTWAAGT